MAHEIKTADDVRELAQGSRPILLQGPPGVGKTMLARRLHAAAPTCSVADRAALAWTLRRARMLGDDGWASGWAHGPVSLDGAGLPTRGLLRAPHHTCSAAGICGGGKPPRPGEVSLAHGGTLFLDELPEFPRVVSQGLAWTLREGHAEIGRSDAVYRFPARPQLLIAAMNPCLCGYLGHPDRACTCHQSTVTRYQARADWFRKLEPVTVDMAPSTALRELLLSLPV